MNHTTPALIPEAIAQLQRRLEEFRSAQPTRTKLPESLWEAAVELARQHGIYTVAHVATGLLYPAEAKVGR